MDWSKYDLKRTKQRDALLQIIMDHDAITSGDVIKLMKAQFPTCSHTTIYDNLNKFERMHIINSFTSRHKDYYYYSEDCRHRFFCEVCQRIFIIDYCPMDAIKKIIPGRIVHHQLFAIIVCQECEDKHGMN